MASPISPLPVMNFPILTPEQMSGHGNLLKNALASFRDITNTSFLPDEKKEALQKMILENMKNKPYAEMAPQFANAELALAKLRPDNLSADTQRMQIANQYAPRMNESQLAYQGAQANRMNTMTPLEAEQMRISNQFAPRTAEANIKSMLASANWRNMGGPGMGTGDKSEMLFHNNVAKDNPQLSSPEQLREAAEAYATGKNQLSDGTKLNPMSEETRRSFDRAIKSTTSAKLITAGVQANQADSELNAMITHVRPVLKDLGTTYNNKSPQQIIDSFSSSDASQERLGRVIGARSLQYAIAQLRNRIDMGEAGINATKELMDNSGQYYTNLAPRLTPKAREEADKFIQEGVQKALLARNKYHIGASGARGEMNNPAEVMGNKNSESSETKELAGKKYKKINGEWHEV